MNILWTFIFILSLILMLFTNPSLIMDTIFSASEKAVNLSISLISIYAFWLGILEICETIGLNKKIAKLLNPLIKKGFNNPNDKTKEKIALNISSNVFGMGNAATPSGIEAMQGLDDGTGKINKGQMLLMLLNTGSIQIIPTTIIGLRITFNSINASNILLPTLLSSFLSTFIGIFLMFLIERIKRKKQK